MKTYMAFDSEDDSKGRVFCINFFDGDKHTTFFDQKSALEWLCDRPGVLELWAVNLGYDLNNLFQGYLEKLEITYVDSRIISARIIKAQVYFRDTLNHWKMSVEEMGKRIGLPKIKTRNFRNVEYCRRDTEITYRFVMEMKNQYAKIGCNLKATIGSTALEYYYSKFGDRPSDEEVLEFQEIEFCKKGYYGGRTEIFFTKPVVGNIQYFDINSLYPSVMRDFGFPRLDKRKWTKHPDFKKEGMADVEMDCPQNIKIPYLSNRNDKGLIFPVGTFRGIYTYFEIRESIKLGYVVRKTFTALQFEGTCSPFIQFVETLYNMRLKAQKVGDKLLSDSAKLIGNNLYGKFGQGNEFTKLCAIKPGEKVEGFVFGNLILKKVLGKYPKHSNAVWACYTTAYARHRLYDGLTKVQNNDGLLIYCDTDSVIFESDKRIIEPSDKLGEFKLEGEFRYAHFKLPKLYCLIPKRGKWVFRAKGVPRKRANDFFRTGKASFRRPYKLRETMRRNLSPTRIEKLIPNYWATTQKEIRKTYDKRVVEKTGHTRPITLFGNIG